MPFREVDTRAKLIDPAIHACGWTEDLIRREETAGAIDNIEGKPRRRAKGRVDYVLRVKVNPDTQAVAVALIEAKAENLPPMHGLEQAKAYGACKRLNVKFVYSSNGHLFVEYQVLTRNPDAVQIGLTATPRKLEMTERTTETLADVRLTADNLRHFGEPVYEYDMSQGIEDGYLAACEIHRFDLFHDNKQANERESGITRGDLSGKDITDAITGETIG